MMGRSDGRPASKRLVAPAARAPPRDIDAPEAIQPCYFPGSFSFSSSSASMEKNRLEAFSDGVIAIIITIMVLELKVPHGAQLADLLPLLPVFLTYLLSFIYVGIYWNNHHHLLHLLKRIKGSVLWANLHFLFWLSLLPFSTGWMGENHFARWPTAVYGLNLLLCALAWRGLQSGILSMGNGASLLAQALRNDLKGKASPFLYSLGILLTLTVGGWAGMAVFVLVAILWFVPDRRFEQAINQTHRQD